jgi:hemoglobin-like flavoprotein
MTDDIVRIRKNWASAIAARDIVGRVFYENLFRIAPATRPLFPETLDEQGRKLVQTLSWIVDHLDQADDLDAGAEALALRHVGYGVTAQQYDAVGTALIATLQAGLGDDFSKEDEAAWVRVYTDLSQRMISAAYPAEAG